MSMTTVATPTLDPRKSILWWKKRPTMLNYGATSYGAAEEHSNIPNVHITTYERNSHPQVDPAFAEANLAILSLSRTLMESKQL